MDAKGALTGIFTQIASGDEATRERCFKFIASKLFTMGPTVITKEIEEFLIEEIKKVLVVSFICLLRTLIRVYINNKCIFNIGRNSR